MITKKEFYFIRHGQTDCNLLGNKVDHPDISLNALGKEQARMVEPIVASLNIDTICFSPYKRAKETKDIICTKLPAEQWEIPHLGECSLSVWQKMTSLGSKAINCKNEAVKNFIQQVTFGINQALDKEGKILIVAHGGIHWALCCLMQVEQDWMIDNCTLVHFFHTENKWTTVKLT